MTQRRMTDEQVSRLDLSAARAELMEEIMREDTTTNPDTTVRLAPRRRGWIPALGAAAAVAVLAAAVFVVPQLGGDGDDSSEAANTPSTPQPPTASATELPGITPAPVGSREWVALSAPGWTAVYVYGSDGYAEVQWENGKQSLEVTLNPAGARAGYVEDRSMIDAPRRDPGTPVTLLGEEAPLWSYSATDHTTIGAVADGHYPEVRGSGLGRKAYLALLDELVWVDRETFQSLLPDTFTTDADRARVIDEMLQDVPVPEGMERIESDQMGLYSLGADVVGPVTCAWLDQFAAAKESGDQQAMQEAREALATSPDWAVLQQMDETGDFPDLVWQFADQVQRGEVPDWYDDGLGCD